MHVTFEICPNTSMYITQQVIIFSAKAVYLFIYTNPITKSKPCRHTSSTTCTYWTVSTRQSKKPKTGFLSRFCFFLLTWGSIFPFKLVYLACNKLSEFNKPRGTKAKLKSKMYKRYIELQWPVALKTSSVSLSQKIQQLRSSVLFNFSINKCCNTTF